jgi:fructose-1,6-bisphosphatase II
MGTGGSTEGVITAAALECLGGEIQAQFTPKDDEQRQRLGEFGIDDPDRVLFTRDLASAPLYVIATGVTDGTRLPGVRYFAAAARTHSIALNLHRRTVRFIDTVHLFGRTPVHEIRLGGVL